MNNDDLPVGSILTRREALTLPDLLGTGTLVACTAPTATPSVGNPTSEPTLEPTASPTLGATLTASVQASMLAGTSALATPVTSANEVAPSVCRVSPAMTEGPYFVDERLNRSDVRANATDGTVQAGVPLKLTLRISQINSSGCAPLADAMVDIWHCDALGVYSDAVDRSFNSLGQDFLRGYQITDVNSLVNFITICPAGTKVGPRISISRCAARMRSVRITSSPLSSSSMMH